MASSKDSYCYNCENAPLENIRLLEFGLVAQLCTGLPVHRFMCVPCNAVWLAQFIFHWMIGH